MSWDGISAIAELVAAIGVVASLAYLAVQIRQNTRHIDFNTRAVRASTFQSFSDTFGKFEDLLLENKQLGNAWVKGLNEEDLEPSDRILFNNLAHKFFRMYEVLYLQHAAGLVENSLFENAHRFPDELLARHGLRRYWQRNQRRYADSFVEFISGQLAGQPVEQRRAATEEEVHV